MSMKKLANGAHGSPLDSIPDFYAEVQNSNPRESRKIIEYFTFSLNLGNNLVSGSQITILTFFNRILQHDFYTSIAIFWLQFWIMKKTNVPIF